MGLRGMNESVGYVNGQTFHSQEVQEEFGHKYVRGWETVGVGSGVRSNKLMHRILPVKWAYNKLTAEVAY